MRVNWAHSPYEGLRASLVNLPHLCVTEQFHDETPWPIFESDSLQNNNSKRVTPFIPRFDLMLNSLLPDR